MPQPIFAFTEEEVPVIYGLAVDTSGSVRPQFQQIIDAAKTIINSNKKGDETFIERFISSDKIETVQDFHAQQRSADGWARHTLCRRRSDSRRRRRVSGCPTRG